MLIHKIKVDINWETATRVNLWFTCTPAHACAQRTKPTQTHVPCMHVHACTHTHAHTVQRNKSWLLEYLSISRFWTSDKITMGGWDTHKAETTELLHRNLDLVLELHTLILKTESKIQCTDGFSFAFWHETWLVLESNSKHLPQLRPLEGNYV